MPNRYVQEGDRGTPLEDREAEGRPEHRTLTRRDFIKWSAGAGVTAGLAGMGVLSALGFVKAPAEPTPLWQIAPGRVDYGIWDSYHPIPATGPDAGQLDGPSPTTLHVAQWYDYWPGSFITDFINYMATTYPNLPAVNVQVSIYESNEELFEWITLGRQRFDVFFPSNYVVDLMKNGNLVYNLNTDWLPNFVKNVAVSGSPFVGVPASNPFDENAWGEFVSVPYFWGTTGLAFRTDVIPRADVEQNGIDLLWMPSWTPSNGSPPLNLVKRMRMLDDERDVLGWGFKKAGWEEQRANGMVPTGIPRTSPASPYAEMSYQWTENETNETIPGKLCVNECRDWLFAGRPNLFDYNSTEDVTSLVNLAAYVNQAWSGDVMYAKRPDQNTGLPVDYVIPKQGSTWWIDCAAIHSKSRNLWLAHQFLNFIHSVDPPWKENQVLTLWNLYSTPNQACYDYFWNLEHKNGPPPALPTPIYPSGWVMTDEPILYPNKFDPEGFARCDVSADVGLQALLNEYNPLWFDLTSA